MSLQPFRLFLLRVFVHSQLYVGCMAGILAFLSMYEWGVINVPIALAVAFITTGGYAYIRYVGTYNNINKENYRSIQSTLLIISVVFTFAGTYKLYFQSPNIIVLLFLLIPPAFLVLLYPIQFSRIPRFRELPGVKLSIIAFSWVWLTTSLPAMLVVNNPDWNILVTHFQRLFLMVAWILPFDIRDMHNDTIKMKTIPQLGGVIRSKQLISLVVFGTQLSFVFTGIIGFTSLSLSLAYILGLEFLNITSQSAKPGIDKGYYNFVIESAPFIVFIFLIVGLALL